MQKTIQINKPSISDIEMMYQLIITKYPKIINDYIEASKLICKEFDTLIDQYDLEKALDCDIETNVEDLKLIYNNVK
jgi:hypothetical protein